MKEMAEITRSYDEATTLGKKTALATVVHVEGSSYRRPGARMLIREDGVLTGAISGGCLEGDALRKALLVIMQQQSMLVTYDTSDDQDAIIGMGLGCNGIIQVLIEPINPGDDNNPIQLLKKITGKDSNAVLVTLFSLEDKKKSQPGTCLLLSEDGAVAGSSQYIEDVLLEEAGAVLHKMQSSFRHYSNDTFKFTAFVEFVPPAISLVIIGAGNDILPLVAMAEIIGWKTTVIDGRPAYAKKERFPASCSVLLAKPEQILEKINITPRTAIVLMTHNYNYDLSMLEVLSGTPIKYIGMLGPKKKLERMQSELDEKNAGFSAEQLSCIYSPVGLDIGAETAEEIALSILAEIKTVFADAKAVSLKENAAPIHNRAALVIENRLVEFDK